MPALSLADLEACDPRHPRRQGETDCCCPLCGDGKGADAAHRCFSYNGQTGAWKCHRCGEAGLLTDFQQREPASGSGRDRSHRELAARFNLPQPIRRRIAAQPAAPLAEPSADQQERRSRWAALMQSLKPLEATAGAAYLEGRGLAADFCHAAGVRFCRDWFGDPAVIFPLRDAPVKRDAVGKLISAQGRAIVLTGGRPNKRTFNRGDSMGVFATPGAWQAERLILTEAPIDALSLAAAGLPALALCGKDLGAARSVWLRPCFYGRHVFLAFDADEAGEEACIKIKAELQAAGAVSVLRLRPEGAKDWNAILQLIGAEALAAQLGDLLESQPGQSTPAVEDPKDAELRILGESLDAELLGQLIDGAFDEEAGGPSLLSEALAAFCDEPETNGLENADLAELIASGDPGSAEAVAALLSAASAGLLPTERVRLGKGNSTSDPAAFIQTNIARVDRLRHVAASGGIGRFLDATLSERIGLIALAQWWAERSAPPALEGVENC